MWAPPVYKDLWTGVQRREGTAWAKLTTQLDRDRRAGRADLWKKAGRSKTSLGPKRCGRGRVGTPCLPPFLLRSTDDLLFSSLLLLKTSLIWIENFEKLFLMEDFSKLECESKKLPTNNFYWCLMTQKKFWKTRQNVKFVYIWRDILYDRK